MRETIPMKHLLPLLALIAAPAFAETAKPAARSTTEPVSRNETAWWKARHEATIKRVAQDPGKVKLVFVGDSITQGWEGAGRAEWKTHFAKYDPVNLGFGADHTEHVIWRLENGEWPAALKPKVVVVMIGTNNTGHKPSSAPQDTAAGISTIIEKIRKASPDSVILLHPIFPRGATPADPFRQINDKVNALIAKLADGTHVKLVDFGAKFLDDKGGLSKTIMPDLLHPNAAGYKIWREALMPEIDKLIAPTTK